MLIGSPLRVQLALVLLKVFFSLFLFSQLLSIALTQCENELQKMEVLMHNIVSGASYFLIFKFEIVKRQMLVLLNQQASEMDRMRVLLASVSFSSLCFKI